jgi:hypothetical protein
MEIPRGNETDFFSGGVFNLMNYAEFAADQQVSLLYQHHFQGLLFNRIPLINRLHTREVVSLNTFYGTLSEKNSYIKSFKAFSEIKDLPYMEASVGVENIFKFLRVDFVYRLTYNSDTYLRNYELANPEHRIRPYGVKLAIQVNL